MPLKIPINLGQVLRRNELFVGAGFRAYFAPFNIAQSVASNDSGVGPSIIDLTTGPFGNSTIPSPFVDLGLTRDFKFTPQSKIGQVRTGYRGAVRVQYKGEIGEQVEFKFREYTRMAYKLGSGTNVMNLLASGTPTPNLSGPLSSSGSTALTMSSYVAGSGNVAPTLTVGSSPSGAGIAVNSWIVADIDYDPTTYGLVGDAGTPVFPLAVTDIDYIRKNSDFVAKVTAVNGNVLTLDQNFAGGGSGSPASQFPRAASKVQRIVGWCAREGGTFISEWSAMFLMDSVDQAQMLFYYPHLSISQSRDFAANWALTNAGTTDLHGSEIDAMFESLAYDDPLDGETVCAYRAFYPRPGQSPAY